MVKVDPKLIPRYLATAVLVDRLEHFLERLPRSPLLVHVHGEVEEFRHVRMLTQRQQQLPHVDLPVVVTVDRIEHRLQKEWDRRPVCV